MKGRLGPFFVTRCNTAKLLATLDTSLEWNYAAFVRLQVVVFDRRFAVGSRRDRRLDASLGQIVADRITVIALVAEKLGRLRIVKLHQRVEALRFVDLAREIEKLSDYA